MIFLYLKIPEESVRFILQDGTWFVQKPLARIVKYKLLAQFQVDHPSHPYMFSLILFQCHFALFVYIYHHITNTYYFVVSYLFLLWLSLELPSEEIQLLSKSFFYLTMSKSFRMRLSLFVAWNIHTVVFLSFSLSLLFLLWWSLYCSCCFWSL